MKKLLFFALTVIFMSFFSLSAYAGSIEVESITEVEYVSEDEAPEGLELSSFEITGGIEKDYESTFDKARTVVGVGEKDTLVTIRIFISVDGELTEVNFYETTIGASGMFSQSIGLELGENLVVITAEKDCMQVEKKVSINRKKLEIKLELEQGMLLPGKKPAS